MNNQEKADLITEKLSGQDLFRCKSVDRVNQKPHPYMVGPRHVTYASDNYGGMLSPDAIIAGEKAGKCKCAHSKCNVPYEEHTKGDEVAFLQLLRNGTNDEANTILQNLIEALGEDGVDGFAFVETDEQFRFSADAS